MLLVNFCCGPDNEVIPWKILPSTGGFIEEILNEAARRVRVGPLAAALFGLRIIGSKLWLANSQLISDIAAEEVEVELRIRFNPYSIEKLEEIDGFAYRYLYYQAKLTVSDIKFKNFMPPSLNKMGYKMNMKRNVEKSLAEASTSSPAFIRRKYLQKAQQCLAELCRSNDDDYHGLVESEVLQLLRREGHVSYSVRCMMAPEQQQRKGGIYLSSTNSGGWSFLCTIDELVAISCNLQERTVELSRCSGIPVYFTLPSLQAVMSLVSCLSGYYRLRKCWFRDLCREVPTPSITELRKIKCHGPVGSEFVCQKLANCKDDSNVAILRQSTSDFYRYHLDILLSSTVISTHVIKTQTEFKLISATGAVILKASSLGELVKCCTEEEHCFNGSDSSTISRLLPPSEYDCCPQLQLAVCPSQLLRDDDDESPKVIHVKKFTESEKILQGSFYQVHITTYRTKNRKVAFKKPIFDGSLELQNRFLSMCTDWCSLKGCDAIVALLGISLRPLGIITEYVPLGPLDHYLKAHKDQLKQVDLLEAVTHLAKALFFLSQEKLQHNNIRCHSLLVARHEANQFWVKLSEPGNPCFDDSCIHWIPREHHYHPPSAKNDSYTDIWAFGTTTWQVFSEGDTPLPNAEISGLRSLYAAGNVLPVPPGCPAELYQIMLQCWSLDPSSRQQPHSIMRDTFQILYQVHNTRRSHAYCTIEDEDDLQLDTVSVTSTALPASPGPLSVAESAQTTLTTLGEDEASVLTLVPLESPASVRSHITNVHLNDGTSQQVRLTVLSSPSHSFSTEVPDACVADRRRGSVSSVSSTVLHSSSTTPAEPPLLVAPTPLSDGQLHPGQELRLRKDTIKIDTPIGEGNYGWVYRGHLLSPRSPGVSTNVAVKSLKVATGNIDDMEREIEIMKKLQHSNIVHLLDVITEDGGDRLYMVMEYLELGSLKTYLQHSFELSDCTLLDYALDIASGMDYLESQRIVHRDLAARNILVAGSKHVKISDFGLAQQLHSSAYYVLRTKRDLPLLWYAPESILHWRYSHKTDVWSYGVTCWEMFTRGLDPNLPRVPSTLLEALQQGTRLNCLPPCPEVVYSKLIRICWDHDPRQRPNFSDLVAIVTELKSDLFG